MFRLNFSHNSPASGQLLIGIGLCLILSAQIFHAIPIASAMMLVGWGATQILACGKFRSTTLLFINLTIYTLLGSYTVAAQTHAATQCSVGHVGWQLWIDHALAMAILLITIRFVLGHLNLPPAVKHD